MNISTRALFILVFLCISGFTAKAQLKASFYYKDSCQATEFDFINTSTPSSSIKQWKWTFLQGTKQLSSKTATTLADADAKGMYFQKDTIITVKLEVTDVSNNTSSVTRNIQIKGNMKARFQVIKHCTGYGPDSAFSLKNISTFSSGVTATKYVINWGDGSTPQTVLPANWVPFSNTIIQHSFSKAGPYLVSLIGYTSTGCKDSFNTPVLVPGKPVANFIAKQNTCEDTAVKIYPGAKGIQFKNMSQENYSYDLKYQWNFGEGGWTTLNPADPNYAKYQDTIVNFVYGGYGPYDVKLIAISLDGCRDTFTQKVYIRQFPSADFSYSNDCSNAPTKFTDKSTDAESWLWQFDPSDPTKTSTEQNPTFTFTTIGTFKVKLTVTSIYGCKKTVTKDIDVKQGPYIEMALVGDCAGKDAMFVDNTSISNKTVRRWDFGDGSSLNATTDTVYHNYKNGGTYNVKLTITGGIFNCTATDSQQLVILPKPVPSFAMNGRCVGNEIQFFDSSTVLNDSIVGWDWDFGDGVTSSLKNPTHKYITSGPKTIKLNVFSKKGCSALLQKSVTILSGPAALIPAPTNACENTPVFFSATPQAGSKFVTWIFDDSASGALNKSTALTTTHIFKSGKTNYNVQAVLRDTTTDCVDTTVKNIVIYKLPIPGFSYTNACQGSAVTFTDTSEYNAGVKKRTWRFAPGVESNATKPTYIFPTAGNHSVTLIVENANGCMDSITKSITVAPKPTANFSYVLGCRKEGIQFLDSSFSANGDIVKYNWNFGDGIDSVMNPIHKFSYNDTVFTVSLIVTTSSGCEDKITKQIKLFPSPEPDFGILTTNKCAGSAIEFSNQTDTVFGSNPVEYFWDFGDSTQPSTDENPVHIYPTANNYEVTLVVTNDKGCKDTIKKTITVLPLPIVNFGVFGSGAGFCVNSSIAFADSSITSSGSPSLYWTANGEYFGAQPTSYKIFSAPGIYTIRLEVTANGCKSFKEKTITVSEMPVPEFSAETVCEGIPTEFKNLTEGTIANVNYIFGDGKTSSRANPTHTYAKAGVYQVKMTVVNGSGCIEDVTKPVEVLAKPTAKLSISSKQVTNSNPTVTFSAKGSKGYDEIQWRFSDKLQETIFNQVALSHTFPIEPVDTGTYYVWLKVINNASGCYDEIMDTIIIGQSLGIQIPNVFTPGMVDSINDEWKPKIVGMGTTYKAIIINRWGQEVYRSNDYKDKGWLGDFQGDGILQEEGVYKYFIQVTDFSNENIFKYQGNITLLK